MRDGQNKTSPLLGKFCGDEIPEEPVSSGNAMFVEFISDFSKNFPGFSASWRVGEWFSAVLSNRLKSIEEYSLDNRRNLV